jgi:hypothetical protein
VGVRPFFVPLVARFAPSAVLFPVGEETVAKPQRSEKQYIEMLKNKWEKTRK